MQEICWPKPIHDIQHAARCPQVVNVTFQLRHAAAGAQQGYQVPTRRTAPSDEPLRVEVVLGGVGPQPAHRGFAVVDLGRELGFRAEAIADVGDSIAIGGEA